LRWLTSLFVSRTATGAPCAFRCSDQRLSTATWVPSLLVMQARLPSNRELLNSAAIRSDDREDRLQQLGSNLALACSAAHPYSASAPRSQVMTFISRTKMASCVRSRLPAAQRFLRLRSVISVTAPMRTQLPDAPRPRDELRRERI
jgi:hypothetical protein